MTESCEEIACYDQLAIVEKYERIIAYLYPIAQSMPRKHGIARDLFLQCLLGQPDIRHALAHGDDRALSQFLTAWSGHACWADTNHLFDFLENHYDLAHCELG